MKTEVNPFLSHGYEKDFPGALENVLLYAQLPSKLAHGT